ncbi:MAG: hypothetical protein AAF250_04125 [Pseudomonadota bacterium]
MALNSRNFIVIGPLGCILLCGYVANAQTFNEVGIQEPEQSRTNISVYNILNRQISHRSTDVVVGPDGSSSQISLNRNYFYNEQFNISEDGAADSRFGYNFTNNLDITWFCSTENSYQCSGPNNSNGTAPSFVREGLIALGNRSVSFNGAYYTNNGMTMHSVRGDGTYLQFDGEWGGVGVPGGPNYSARAITRDGVQYMFIEKVNGVVQGDQGLRDIRAYGGQILAWDAFKVIFPNGEVLRLYYGEGSSKRGVLSDGRVERIENSRGYGLKIRYLTDVFQLNTRDEFTKIREIEAYRKICISSCQDKSLGSVRYTYNSDFRLTSFTDFLGRQFTYQYNNREIESFTGPDGVKIWAKYKIGSPPSDLGIAHGEGDARLDLQFTSQDEVVFDDGSVQSFQINTDHNFNSLWPENDWLNSTYKTYHEAPIIEGVFNKPGNNPWWRTVVSSEDQIGRVTEYEYDVFRRLITIKHPEENLTHFKRDERGNIFERVERSKPTLDEPDIVTRAVYPSCNASNFKICNKPSYIIDPDGRRTNYTWSATHGGLLAETAGYDSAGNCTLAGGCTEVTHSYSSFTGVDNAVFYLLTETTTKVSSSASHRITYSYDISNGFTLLETVEETGGVSLRTCYQHDDFGRIISETQPQAGLTSCQ